MQSFAERIVARALSARARLALPEATEARVLQAAAKLASLGVANVQLIGNTDAIAAAAKDAAVALDSFELLDPSRDAGLDELAGVLRRRRPGMTDDDVEQMVREPVYYGALKLGAGESDALVAGAVLSSATVIRAGLQCVGLAPGINTASSFFAMEFPSQHPRSNQVLIFADCAVVIDPTATQLADIAIGTAGTAQRLLDESPRVALLSFSTHSSASHVSVDKVQNALALVQARAPHLAVDGEMQADAALNEAVARRKLSGAGPVQGDANVLVFPDVNAGNIAYKLTQYLAGARAYGPVLQGFARPVSDLSRGASVEDIVMTAAITLAMSHHG